MGQIRFDCNSPWYDIPFNYLEFVNTSNKINLVLPMIDWFFGHAMFSNRTLRVFIHSIFVSPQYERFQERKKKQQHWPRKRSTHSVCHFLIDLKTQTKKKIEKEESRKYSTTNSNVLKCKVNSSQMGDILWLKYFGT